MMYVPLGNFHGVNSMMQLSWGKFHKVTSAVYGPLCNCEGLSSMIKVTS